MKPPDRTNPEPTRRSGASLVDIVLHLTMLISAVAGAWAGRRYGAVGIVQGLVCGFVIGGLGILFSMLLISGFVALLGAHEKAGRIRKGIDNIAAVILVLLLAATPIGAAVASSRAITWLHRK